MFEQLLSNKNKITTVLHSVAQYIRNTPNRASKQGLTSRKTDRCGGDGQQWQRLKAGRQVGVDGRRCQALRAAGSS
jgi:hypothetical protein